MSTLSLIAPPEARTPPSTNPSTIEILEKDAPELVQLLKESPDLKIFTKQNSQYDEIREIFFWKADQVDGPLGIVRPTTEQQVSDIVKYCREHDLKFSVRAGGNDVSGRSVISGRVVIDLRELDSIEIADDKKSVLLGGGSITGPTLEFLQQHGLAVATGVCDTVGLVGWATAGGYGPLNGLYGLGVDQIVGARVVVPTGEIVEADEELLWGLRGGGANFGVITHIQVKAYSVPKFFAGIIIFPLEQAVETFVKYEALLEQHGNPPEFGGEVVFMDGPDNTVQVIHAFSWVGTDEQAAKSFFDKIAAIGTPVVTQFINHGTYRDYMKLTTPKGGVDNVSTGSVTVSKLSKKTIEIIVEHLKTAVAEGIRHFIFVHPSHNKAAEPNSGASYSNRQQHFVLEIVYTGTEAVKADAQSLYEAVSTDLRGNSDAVLPWNYPNFLTLGNEFSYCYDDFPRLVALKDKYDPQTGRQGCSFL